MNKRCNVTPLFFFQILYPILEPYQGTLRSKALDIVLRWGVQKIKKIKRSLICMLYEIYIINMRNGNKGIKKDLSIFRVDRASVVGNPFYMKDESKRNEVCDKYEIYFNKMVNEKNEKFMEYLEILKKALVEKKKLVWAVGVHRKGVMLKLLRIGY